MSAIVENAEAAFRDLVPGRSELLTSLEKEAAEESVPIVGPVVGHLLHALTRFGRCERVLELGTAIGYSGIFLADAVRGENGRLITVEHDPDTADRARKNFQKAGLDDRVEVRTGEAAAILENLSGPFDLVFLDIDKPSYAGMLPEVKRLLRVGGLLIADNTGFSEAGSFNQAILSDPSFLPVQILAFLPGHSPEQDGLCVALKR